MFDRAIFDVFIEGDEIGNPFTFPILTINLTKSFKSASTLTSLISKLAAKYGTPYFQNLTKGDPRPSSISANNRKYGGLWGNFAQSGSIGSVDINLPQAAYKSHGSEREFFHEIRDLLQLSKETLEIKRDLINRYISLNLIPYTKYYLSNLENHSSTIGIIGMSEAFKNLGTSIESEAGSKLAVKTLLFIRKYLQKFSDETGNVFQLEASPNENASYLLALKDKEKSKKIITSGKDEPFYTNSSELPANSSEDLDRVLETQEKLLPLYTGGSAFHTFLKKKPEEAACMNLITHIAYKYDLPHFTITPTYSICTEHGYLEGEMRKCPETDENGKNCGHLPLVYSRVGGYYRPLSKWNKGKIEEFRSRRFFKIS